MVNTYFYVRSDQVKPTVMRQIVCFDFKNQISALPIVFEIPCSYYNEFAEEI